MRTKSFPFAFATSILFAFGTHFTSAEETWSFSLNRNHVAPVTALEEAVALLPKSPNPLVSAGEMDMFKKFAAHDYKSISETDVILNVADIRSDESRRHYAAQLDDITAGARRAIASGKTDDEIAGLLGKFLLEHPLHGGGDGGQCEMKVLLDKGTYNCVSSATLYNLIANRLGLHTRCVTIPDHIFLTMGDLCIEPTSGTTQNKKDHDKAVVDKLWSVEANNPFYKGIFGKTRSREHGNLGLFGGTYADRDLKYVAAHQYEQAAITSIKALCLDIGDRSFAFESSTAINDWFLLTLKQKNYSKAQKIAEIHRQLFGDHSKALSTKSPPPAKEPSLRTFSRLPEKLVIPTI